jgi:hypothetical protein
MIYGLAKALIVGAGFLYQGPALALVLALALLTLA